MSAITEGITRFRIIDEVGLDQFLRETICAFEREGAIDLRAVLGEIKRRLIAIALTRSNGNRTVAAEFLRVRRSVLEEKMRWLKLLPNEASETLPSYRE